MGRYKNTKGGPKKRGRCGLTTEAQEQFLTSKISTYLALQGTKARSDFWPTFWEEYFKLWPLPLTSDTEKDEDKVDPDNLKKAKQRVKEWFNNHTREMYSARDKRKNILDLKVKKRKLLPDWQAYSLLYYDTRVKDVVADTWPAERARLLEQKKNGEEVLEAPEAAPFWFRNKTTRSEFNMETEEVKNEVNKYKQSLSEDTDLEGIDPEMDPEEAKRIIKACARKKAQAPVPQTITKVLEQIREQSGYVGFIALAAPEVQRDGRIKTLSLFSGQTPLNHDFGDSYTANRWREHVLAPLREFAEKVYHKQLQQLMVVQTTNYGFVSAAEAHKSWVIPNQKGSDETVGSASNSQAPTIDPTSPMKTVSVTPKAPHVETLKAKSTTQDVYNEDDDDDLYLGLDEQINEDTDNEKTSPTNKKAPVPATKLGLEPQVKIDNSHKDWDNGEPLTSDQRKEILALGSDYERSRAMNKCRNARLLKELDLKNGVRKALTDSEGGKTSTGSSDSKSKRKTKV